jgi:signal-transduction protein with cAMP-binding, CBS, and nucleotidyltransferase domain
MHSQETGSGRDTLFGHTRLCDGKTQGRSLNAIIHDNISYQLRNNADSTRVLNTLRVRRFFSTTELVKKRCVRKAAHDAYRSFTITPMKR